MLTPFLPQEPLHIGQKHRNERVNQRGMQILSCQSSRWPRCCIYVLCAVVPCRFATRIFIHVHVHLRHVASACKCPSTAHMHIDMSSICRWASSKRWCTAALKGVFVRGVQSLTVAIFDQDSITKGKKLVGCTFADLERTKHVCDLNVAAHIIS